MWKLNANGYHEFTRGQIDWDAAALAAWQCGHFKPDDEDEMVAEDLVSCYNCRYRRWTKESFQCCYVRVS